MARNAHPNLGDWLYDKGKVSAILGIFLTLALFLALNAATTLKARFNVLQIVCWGFFIVLIVRHIVKSPSLRGDPSVEGKDRTRLWVAVILGFAAYAATFGFFFNSDDFAHLEWAQGSPVELLWQQLTKGQSQTFFRPFGFASLLLDYHLWHNWPLGYHLTNVLLHAAGISGLFFFCKQLGLGARLAGNAALVFSILPVQAEAVTWIAARFDLLATCLTIWVMVFYVKYRTSAGRRAFLWALVLVVPALLAKESAFALPLLLLLVEFLCLQERRSKLLLSLTFLSFLIFCYRWSVLGGIGGYVDASGRSSFLVLGRETLEGLLLRTPTHLLFGINWFHQGLLPVVLYASLVGGALLALSFTAKPSQHPRLLWFSLAWVFLAGIPAHSLLLVNPGLTGSRVYYLPSVGAALLLAFLLSSFVKTGPRRCWTAVILLLLGFGLLHNLSAWQRVSGLSHRFLLELEQLEPDPPRNSHFLFARLPQSIDGVDFFANGLSHAVRMTYDRQDLEAVRESDPGVSQLPESADQHLIRVRWKDGGKQLLELQ